MMKANINQVNELEFKINQLIDKLKNTNNLVEQKQIRRVLQNIKNYIENRL